MNKGLGAPFAGGINIYIKCNIQYIQLEGASFPRNRRVTTFIKCIVGYIEVGGASCPTNMWVTYFYTLCCRI